MSVRMPGIIKKDNNIINRADLSGKSNRANTYALRLETAKTPMTVPPETTKEFFK
ncbi:hypothetical protein PAT3040_00212 [Paenibacillus agaridevorans]|uniref:Uncharacterized protein n=1 Tax=Paenibacillus agaridevorans TaxID=171404 RepID=A0A2R5EL79_9BACL|nr:hypothetical protein PAT3040_00212 [Paenibacillus agaridevorans]